MVRWQILKKRKGREEEEEEGVWKIKVKHKRSEI